MASPDFLCIGAQKAGTTWLDKMFKGHPDIWTPPVKELQFFNEFYNKAAYPWTQKHRESHAVNAIRYAVNEKQPNWEKIKLAMHIASENIGFDWYEKIFDYAPEGVVKGEMTPEYSLLNEKHVKEISEKYPKLKIIFIMRDPVERALSGIRMRMKQQGFNADSKQEDIDNFVIEAASNWDVIQRSNYSFIHKTWSDYFDSESCLFLLSSDLRNNSKKALIKVGGFLGVDYNKFKFNPDEKVHVGMRFNISENAILEVRKKQEDNTEWMEENSDLFKIGL
ncbi:sulfotransferase [Endozoicomonas euniceicola]|uniref:Sulfotransferase n=1 Tax=Endozoicomonas euniceicola TaxID=1234143 RepID=A0ABY6H2N1_9GAMM|nr:sulfotransferase [Endozoicomonas euniceicola]UYM18511.1 sulfotransferase [Endozoicomonas euniceicola]